MRTDICISIVVLLFFNTVVFAENRVNGIDIPCQKKLACPSPAECELRNLEAFKGDCITYEEYKTLSLQNNFVICGLPKNRLPVLPCGCCKPYDRIDHKILGSQTSLLNINIYFNYTCTSVDAVEKEGIYATVRSERDIKRVYPSPKLQMLTIVGKDYVKLRGLHDDICEFVVEDVSYSLPEFRIKEMATQIESLRNLVIALEKARKSELYYAKLLSYLVAMKPSSWLKTIENHNNYTLLYYQQINSLQKKWQTVLTLLGAGPSLEQQYLYAFSAGQKNTTASGFSVALERFSLKLKSNNKSGLEHLMDEIEKIVIGLTDSMSVDKLAEASFKKEVQALYRRAVLHPKGDKFCNALPFQSLEVYFTGKQQSRLIHHWKEDITRQ